MGAFPREIRAVSRPDGRNVCANVRSTYEVEVLWVDRAKGSEHSRESSGSSEGFSHV